MTKEIWKNIKGYTHYEVSNKGNVRSLDKEVPCRGGKFKINKGKLKKLQVNNKGYLITTLSHKGKLSTYSVHQLVAQAFLKDFVKSDELNHIDGVKTNNDISNLELSNPSHNQLHAVRIGLVKPKGASKYHHVSYIKNNPKAKARWAVCIRHNGKSSFGWKTFMTELEAAVYADELLDSINDKDRLRNFS